LIYGLCLPLALYLGYILANPLDTVTMYTVMVLLFLLCLPVLIRAHHALLIFSWSCGAEVFFVKGHLQLWMVLTLISLGITIVYRALNREMKFCWVNSVAAPLVFLGIVTAVTAYVNGGIGIRALGSDMYGGKRYVWIGCAILGYFALASHRIPLNRARWYAGIYFLPQISAGISSLVTVLSPSLYWIYLFFPADPSGVSAVTSVETASFVQISRLGGLAVACRAVFVFLLARYGIRGLLGFRNSWRLALLVTAFVLSALGGFRSVIASLVLLFVTVYYLSGLLRTRLTIVLAIVGLASGLSLLPFVRSLPLPMQRAVSFLPVDVDPVAAADAEGSSQWRFTIWSRLWPEVHHYLWMGKGFNINGQELELANQLAMRGGDNADVALISGDYHNGPLSILIPLGVWGVLGFLWFIWASIRVLYRNYRYGDPELKTLNTLLLAYFVVQSFSFLVIFGGFYADLCIFTGLVGFSLSLNGGVCRKPVPVREEVPAYKRLRSPRNENPAELTPFPALSRNRLS
jgi:hypothetical protein